MIIPYSTQLTCALKENGRTRQCLCSQRSSSLKPETLYTVRKALRQQMSSQRSWLSCFNDVANSQEQIPSLLLLFIVWRLKSRDFALSIISLL